MGSWSCSESVSVREGGGEGRTRQYSRLVLRLEISTIVNHSTIGGSWSNATGICVKYNSLITENSWHRYESPRVGFEPTTNRLTADRSTAELPRKMVGDSVSYTLKDFFSGSQFQIWRELSFLCHFVNFVYALTPIIGGGSGDSNPIRMERPPNHGHGRGGGQSAKTR